MKFFAASINEAEVENATVAPPYNILISFHYFKKKQEYVRGLIEKGFDVFIDSGAFSAANRGAEINIEEYCIYLKDTGAKIYAGLDVIGNAKETLANNEYMIKKHGLNPIPTFHLGGNTDDLRKLFDYNYIALGGMVFGSGLTRYCDEVWSIILKERPDMRVHGFGLTNEDLMARYPWYSVDSSSWKSCGLYGRQNILWNGFEFKMFQEEEYLALLDKRGYVTADMTKKQKRFLYFFYSVQDYKLYGEHLKAVNKTKDFSYLTGQQKFI